MNMTTVERIDTCGAFLSFTCAIHCLAMPILLVAFPLIGLEFISDGTIETFFITGMVAIALLTMWSGFRRHRRHAAFVFFAVALSFLLTGLILENDFHRPLIIFGAIGIAAAHILNRRFCCAQARGCLCPEGGEQGL